MCSLSSRSQFTTHIHHGDILDSSNGYDRLRAGSYVFCCVKPIDDKPKLRMAGEHASVAANPLPLHHPGSDESR